MGNMLTEAQTLNPGGVLELFSIDFTTRLTSGGSGPSVMRFTNEQLDVTFGSNVYSSTSVEFRPADISLDTTFPKAQLLVYGQNSDLLSAINGYSSIRGSTLTYIMTHENFIDSGSDPGGSYEERYVVSAVKQRSKDRIELEVSPGIAMDNIIQPALRTITNG